MRLFLWTAFFAPYLANKSAATAEEVLNKRSVLKFTSNKPTNFSKSAARTFPK